MHNLTDKPEYFLIPEDEWKELRKRQHKNHFKSLHWTNVMAEGIRSVHPFCSFAFKRHSVKPIGSNRKGPLFTCSAYCLFEDCPVEVQVKVLDESSLKANLMFKGETVKHSCEELKRRPVRADQRQVIADSLTTKLPRSLYLENLGKLDQSIIDSGCRDQVPTTGVLKTLSWSARKKHRRHQDDMLSLQAMFEEERGSEEAVIQKIIMHPKGIMLWSEKTIKIFHERCKEDIVYLDATGSIVQKGKCPSGPFYVYELVVRNPRKGSSPVPVATYLTTEHTTASVSYFLGSFVTDLIRMHGQRIRKRPVMLICDGSTVLLQSISHNFCGMSLQDLLYRYFAVVTGKGQEDCLGLPILHRCLSHVMKNAKDLCRKQ